MRGFKDFALLMLVIVIFVLVATGMTFCAIPEARAAEVVTQPKNILAVITVGPFVVDRNEAREMIKRSVKVETYEEYMQLYPYIVAETEKEYEELISKNPTLLTNDRLPRNMNTCAYMGDTTK